MTLEDFFAELRKLRTKGYHVRVDGHTRSIVIHKVIDGEVYWFNPITAVRHAKDGRLFPEKNWELAARELGLPEERARIIEEESEAVRFGRWIASVKLFFGKNRGCRRTRLWRALGLP